MLRKLTDFMVEKRNYILILMVILTGVAGFLSTKVKINYDMMDYLPDDSETRQGLDIMTAEFGEEETSQLSVTVADLAEAEKTEWRDKLAGVSGVEEVAYDASETYNRENYTKYILTVGDVADSEQARATYTEVREKLTEELSGREFATSGEVDERNREVLPLWILGLAIGCALVILLVMSESYVEPFLFMTAILMAVVLNKGTNLIFPSVSHITDSITAILQLALSMDYSIMLMERFRQEKARQPDKVLAMKAALGNAFTAIASSSVTTVVGLLALVFMSFTIGRDMGLVLAKGVLFSLLAIFTCLPGLILLFDRAITKTQKKCPTIRLDSLGKAAYKLRYVAAGVFVLAFVVSYLFKGNLGITYTEPEQNELGEVFPRDNQMALVYANADEAAAAEKCREVARWTQTGEVLCYGNTIGEKLAVGELNPRLEELGTEVGLEEDLARILYYHYYNQGQTGKTTATEFVNFVQGEVYANERFGGKVDAEMRRKIAQLENFTERTKFATLRGVDGLAGTLEIAPETVDDLLVYHNARNVGTRLSLAEFVRFAQDYVLPREKYGQQIDAGARAQLAEVGRYLNREDWLRQRNAAEMAEFLGLQPEAVQKLYLYQVSLVARDKMTPEIAQDSAKLQQLQAALLQQAEAWKMSGAEMVDSLLARRSDAVLKQALSAEQWQALEKLAVVKTSVVEGRTYAPAEMAQMLGGSAESMRLLYSLYEVKYLGKDVRMSLYDFVGFLLEDVMSNPQYGGNFTPEERAKLATARSVMDGVINAREYTAEEWSGVLRQFAPATEQKLIEALYLYHDSIYHYVDTWQLTVEELVNYLNETVLADARFEDFIDATMRTDAQAAQEKVAEAKRMLVGENYARVILNTHLAAEGGETFDVITDLKARFGEGVGAGRFYLVGNSPMAYETAQTFGGEMDMITVITMAFIFVVVAVTFRSVIVPAILVLLIQCAVYLTMGMLSLSGTSLYFIALLIVQSILMGATIDYAVLYTSYYMEARRKMPSKAAVVAAYNQSIQAIATSSLILIIVTLIVGQFTTAVVSKITTAISQGTTLAVILILFLLPAVLAAWDRVIVKKNERS